MNRGLAAIFAIVLGFSIACMGSRQGHELQPIELPRAHHATTVPLRAFAVPMTTVSDCATYSGELDYLVVELSLHEMRVGRKVVFDELDGGLVPAEHKRGKLISALFDRVLELGEINRDRATMGCFFGRMPGDSNRPPGRILISADSRIPAATLTEVVFTVGQAQLGRIHLRVGDTTPDRPLQTHEQRAVGPTLTATDHDTLVLLPHGGRKQTIDRQNLANIDTDHALLYLPLASQSVGDVVAVLDALPADLRTELAHNLPGRPEPAIGRPSGNTSESIGLDEAIPVVLFETESGFSAAPERIGTLRLGPIQGDYEGVKSTISRQRNALRYCAAKFSTLDTEVEIKVTIEPTGKVSSTQVLDAGSADQRLQKCLMGRFQRMKFPQPPARTHIRQRLYFESP